MDKKGSFPLRISSINVTKCAVSCGFGHIYWRNPQWKTSFFERRPMPRGYQWSRKLFWTLNMFKGMKNSFKHLWWSIFAKEITTSNTPPQIFGRITSKDSVKQKQLFGTALIAYQENIKEMPVEDTIISKTPGSLNPFYATDSSGLFPTK